MSAGVNSIEHMTKHLKIVALKALSILAMSASMVTLGIFFPEIMVMMSLGPLMYILIKPLLPEDKPSEAPETEMFKRIRSHLSRYRYSYLLAAVCLACAGGIVAMSFFIPFVASSSTIALVAAILVNPTLSYLLPPEKKGFREPRGVKQHFIQHRNTYIKLVSTLTVAAGLIALSFFVPYVLAMSFIAVSVLKGLLIGDYYLNKRSENQKNMPQWAKYAAALLIVSAIAVLAVISFTTPLAPLATATSIFVLNAATSSFLSMIALNLTLMFTGTLLFVLNKQIANGLTQITTCLPEEESVEELTAGILGQGKDSNEVAQSTYAEFPNNTINSSATSHGLSAGPMNPSTSQDFADKLPNVGEENGRVSNRKLGFFDNSVKTETVQNSVEDGWAKTPLPH